MRLVKLLRRFASVTAREPLPARGSGRTRGCTKLLMAEPLEPRMLLATSPLPSLFELSSLLPENGGDGSQGVVLNGGSFDLSTGWSVSNAGDMNGDGFDEMLISAGRGNGASGVAYVVFGDAEPFPPEVELAALDGVNGFCITGGSHPDLVEIYSVSRAGDVNGDGFGDVLIGASRRVNEDERVGIAFVVFGRAEPFGSLLDVLTLDGADGFRIEGNPEDSLGYTVAAAGDVNADGFADVLVYAPGANEHRGADYCIFGHAGPFDASLHVSSLDGVNGFAISFNHLAPGDAPGWSLSGAGDINSDGVDDMVIGAVSANEGAGAAYVVFGRESGFDASFDFSELGTDGGFVFHGQSNDSAGYSMSGGGDVNGDGIADLLVGAMTANSASGAGYVIFGRAGSFPPVMDATSLDGDQGFVIQGLPNDYIGPSVSDAGDVNGDGISDVWVGGMGVRGFAGGGYVVFGHSGLFLPPTFDVSVLDGDNGYAVWGVNVSDLTGWSASSGDFNGDGGGDVLIGAFNANGGTGAAYVVFGQPSPINTPPSIVSFASDSAECGAAREMELVTVVGSFTDPDSTDTHAAIVTWGDGLQSAAQIVEIDGVYYVSASHAYAQGGFYDVTLTVADAAGESSTATTTTVISGAGINPATGVLYVVGTDEKDHVHVKAGNGELEVQASFLAERKRFYSAGEIVSIHVILCAGNDHAVIDQSVTLDTILDGGKGDDHLMGGNGSTLLLGGAGDDHLQAGSGRDVLIGGIGRDHLRGGMNDDILIGGFTEFDRNQLALGDVMREWRRSDLDYNARVANLIAMLNTSMVHDDGDGDVLTGGNSLDWFFANLEGENDRRNWDKVTDAREGEVVLSVWPSRFAGTR